MSGELLRISFGLYASQGGNTLGRHSPCRIAGRASFREYFEFGKDHFGLDHSQVRLYTAYLRHVVLTMAALAVCAVTAAQARASAPAPILPVTPDDQPPQDRGLIASPRSSTA